MPIGELLGGQEVRQALTANRGREPFYLSALPYAYDALEPVIDYETMKWHHDVVHRSYVDRLNEALRDVPINGLSLEEIFARISRFSPAVRDFGGGHWNHTFFWSVMTDRKEDQEISQEVLHAIERSFGSLEQFKNEFVRVGNCHVGSGWIWLIKVPDEGKTGEPRLRLATTSNHDNPLMDVSETKGVPILACDLWEHGYYLRFKARREEFLRRFLAIVNWARVEKLYAGGYH